MAVEIPVVIDIDAAFKEAAGRVKTSMKPLEDVINSAPMSLFIDVKIGKSKKALIELFDEPRTTLAQFQSALDQVNARINKMAAKGGFSLLGSGLKAEEKELLEAASLLETKIKGVGNASSTMGNVLTLNMQRAEAEITKYTAKLDQLQRKQNLSGKATGGLDPRVNVSKYQRQIDDVNIKLKETRTFLAACSIELDRMGIKARQVGVAVDLSNKAAIEMAAGFRRGHEAIQRWNAGLAQSNSHLLALIKGSATLVALHSATRFIQNVRNVTAEFEMQRVALGGIIQDTERAEKLFKQLKAAAIQSPFEIKDLVSFTKQLSAYRIETENLFDVTMRLADISAGLGVDMSRLVLAYGQVRAAAVLRGQELRQFTEAGIPLVDLLAEKFTKLNGRTVKTAEVFDLISKRAVPFSMIKEIFEDMTNAGGIFYKMQEKQSETLKGQWMKLKDAASIMYDEIGNTGTVHKAMTDLLATSMRLMQNWRETGKVLKGLVASIVAYKIVVANARIAANALTAAEVAEISALELNTVSRSKLIAAIFGETAATKLSITLGNAYVAVKTREMMATNLFTKALYRMLAAMLKNPYALAAAAIAALIYALVKLAKKSDESRISIDNFQKSVESFNKASSHADDIDKLCDKYDQLANKADRTKEETDELVRVTKELGRAYPQAINGTDAQTGALALNTEAIRENNKEAREAIRLKMELDKQRAENSMADLVEERNKIIAQLQSGTKLQYVQTGSGMYGQSGTYQEVNLSDEDRAKFGERLMELNKQIGEFQEAINDADKALQGLSDDLIGPPLPDFFGDAWRSQLNSYTTTLKSTNTKVKALTKDQIEGFGDQRDALKAVAKEYEAQTALVDFYTKAMVKATGARRAQTEQSLADAKLMQEMYKKILEDFNALDLVKDKGGKGYTADPFIQTMQDRMKFMQDFKKGYDNLAKYMGKAGALGQESSTMETRGLSLGISAADQKRAAEELSKWYQDAIDEAFKKAQKYGAGNNLTAFLSKEITGSSNKAKALRDFQKLLQSLWDAKTDFDTTQMTKNFEEAFKKMKEELKRSAEIRNFYSGLLDATGDQDLAMTLTLSVYGGEGVEGFTESIQKQLNESLEKLNDMPDVGLDDAMRKAFGDQDFDYILANMDKFPEEMQKHLREIAEEVRKHDASWVNDLVKTYQKSKSFEERITDVKTREANKRVEIQEWEKKQLERIEEEYQKEIARIEASDMSEPEKVKAKAEAQAKAETQTNVIKKESAETQAASQKKEGEETAQIELEALKTTYEWTKAFEDLENVSTATLEGLIALLDEYIQKAGATASPEDLKTVTQAKEKAETQVQSRGNSYKTIIKELQAYAKAKKTANRLEKEGKKNTIEYKKAQDSAQKSLMKAKKGVAEVGDSFNTLSEIVSSVSDILQLDELSDGQAVLSGIAAGLTLVGTALIFINAMFTMLESNPIVLAISAIIASVAALAMIMSNLSTAKANREIAAQEKVVKNLEKEYDRLDKAMEKAFGADYISDFNAQQEVLKAKIVAYNRMIAAEQSKGKKTDEDKIEGWLDDIEEAEEKLKEMETQLSEHFSGTDLTSAARDFAEAWIEAYQTFASTTGAMKDKFKEMIQSMVTESLAAAVMQKILQPVFDKIDQLANEGGELSEQDIAQIAAMSATVIDQANASMTALMQNLAKYGVNMRGLDSNLTGISKDIAGASEQSINGLAAGINTQNFYMSYVPTISADVAAIRAALVGASTTPAAAPASTNAAGTTSSTFGDEKFRTQMEHLDENIASLTEMIRSVRTPRNANTNTHCIATK